MVPPAIDVVTGPSKRLSGNELVATASDLASSEGEWFSVAGADGKEFKAVR